MTLTQTNKTKINGGKFPISSSKKQICCYGNDKLSQYSPPFVSSLNQNPSICPTLRRDYLIFRLCIESDEAVWLVGRAEGEGLVLGVLGGGDRRTMPAVVANPSYCGEDERAGQQGSTTEEEGGRVTSCYINQPTWRKRRRNVKPAREYDAFT